MVRARGAWILLLGALAPACARQVPGRVLDEQRSPIDGAEVVAYAAPGRVVARAVASHGQFTLALDDGVSRFVAIARQPKAGLVGAATWETVGDDIVLVVGPTVTVTGEVLDSRAEPIYGASVAVAQLRPQVDGGPVCVIDEPTQCGFPQLRGSTDGQGRYRLEGVPRGWLGTVRVDPGQRDPVVTSPLVGRWQFTPGTVTTIPATDQHLERTAAWAGLAFSVRDRRPVANVRIELLTAAGERLATTSSSRLGYFHFQHVPAEAMGALVLPSVESGLGPELQVLPKPKSPGNFGVGALELYPAAKISGRVLERGSHRPWPGLRIAAVPRAAAEYHAYALLRRETTTEADGTFRLNAAWLPCDVTVERDGEVVASTVSPGWTFRPTENLVLEVSGPQTLRVQILRPDGHPAVRQRLLWRDALPGPDSKVRVTDAYGGADLPGSPQRWCRLGFVLESEQLAATRVVERETGGRTVQVQLERTPRCTARGRVLGPGDKPIAAAVVVAQVSAGRPGVLADPRIPAKTALTGPDGAYRLDGMVEGGPLRLAVQAPGYRSQSLFCEPTAVTEGRMDDARLVPATRAVSGRLAGQGAAYVFADGLVDEQPVAIQDGREFTLTGLPDTPLTLRATDAAGQAVAEAHVDAGQSRVELWRTPLTPDWHAAPTPADRALASELLHEAMRETQDSLPELERAGRATGEAGRLTGKFVGDALAAGVGNVARWLAAADLDAALAAIAKLPPSRQHLAVIGWLRLQPYGAPVPPELDRLVAAISDDDGRELAAAHLVAALPPAEAARAGEVARTALRGAGGVPARMHHMLRRAMARLSLLARTGLSATVLEAEVTRLLEQAPGPAQDVLAERFWLGGMDLRLAPLLRKLLTEPDAKRVVIAAWVRDLADLDPAAALRLARDEGLDPATSGAVPGLDGEPAAALSHRALRLLPTQPAESRALEERLPEVWWRCDERAAWALAHTNQAEAAAAAALVVDRRAEDGNVADLPLLDPLPARGPRAQRLRARLLSLSLPMVPEELPELWETARQTNFDLAYGMSQSMAGRSRWMVEQLLADEPAFGAQGAILALVAHDPPRAVQLCRALPTHSLRSGPLLALALWFAADERGRRAWLPTRPEPLPRGSSSAFEVLIWTSETDSDTPLPDARRAFGQSGAWRRPWLTKASGYSFEWPAS